MYYYSYFTAVVSQQKTGHEEDVVLSNVFTLELDLKVVRKVLCVINKLLPPDKLLVAKKSS